MPASSDTGIPFKAGNVVTCDVFYEFDDWWKKWAQMGVQAVEMETAALYMNAAYNHVNALSMISISDQLCDRRQEQRGGTPELFYQYDETCTGNRCEIVLY